MSTRSDAAAEGRVREGERQQQTVGGRSFLSPSALHPKVLCELLHLEEVFSVDGRTSGGERAQHVGLRGEREKQALVNM